MPTKPTTTQKITAWSYSRWSDYEKCPFMCMLKHVRKIREPDNEHQARGTVIHKEAELWSTGKTEGTVEVGGREQKVKVSKTKIPQSLKCFEKEFAELRKIRSRLATEQQVGFTKTWGVTEWFDSDARRKGLEPPSCRVTMDCRFLAADGETMKIVDYKTGRVREENKVQTRLYAVAGFALDERVKKVEAELWYLDQGVLNDDAGEPLVYLRKDEKALRKDWETKTRKMLNDVQFKPKPSKLCGYCHYRKDNAAAGGGQCKY